VIDRRTFLAGTGAVLLAAPLAAGAQQVARTATRIGVLSPPEPLTALDVLQHGSLHLGYTDGNSIHECQRRVSA
jgi:hypothetical protein